MEEMRSILEVGSEQLQRNNMNREEKEKIKEAEVKDWYDVFSFGSRKDIYNSWSIINYLENRKISSVLGKHEWEQSGKPTDSGRQCVGEAGF